MPSIASRLYHGDISIDFVGRWRRWAVLSGVVLLISLVSLVVPGLRFGYLVAPDDPDPPP